MKALGLIPLLAAPLPGSAQVLTGERLYQICRERTSAEWREAGHWICPSYIRGIIDGARLQALRSAGGSIPDHVKTLMICDPPTATGDEAITFVVRYLEALPEARSLPAAVVVFRGLGEAWPCKP
ncbi:Rap1a/Tai family immunity protein [uncultured Methylobacterium sp.]|uniref:Rap1a/Tai family immunity protein n=1 Tax=uncultured Methylobacterium sp. TaxID=157278 RepID=UPI0035C979B5